jgi:hypothetical protein
MVHSIALHPHVLGHFPNGSGSKTEPFGGTASPFGGSLYDPFVLCIAPEACYPSEKKILPPDLILIRHGVEDGLSDSGSTEGQPNYLILV